MTIVPSPGDVETVERVIPAPPEQIFDLLTDPSRHPTSTARARCTTKDSAGSPGARARRSACR